MLDGLAGFFFGRDVFISYSYDDSEYAEALAVALQSRKFSVFLGGWGASPGKDLSRNVVRAAHLCRLLVIVGSAAAAASPAVQREVDIMSKRHKTVVPIDIGGALGGRHRWPGTDPVHEEPGRLPSPHVIGRIENAEKFARQEQRLRRFIGAVAVTALVLIVGSAWFLRVAYVARDDAEAASATASQNVIDSVRAVHAKRKELAQVSRQLSLTEAEQKRQAAIATASQMANDANLLLQREPGRLIRAALLAAASVRQLHELGVHSIGSDSAIRGVAALLPRDIRKKRLNLAQEHVISGNGRYLATSDGAHSAILIDDLDDRQSVRTIHVCDGSVGDLKAVSNDGRTVVAEKKGSGRSETRAWRDGVLVDRPIESNVRNLALSDDGAMIATIEKDEERTVIVRRTDGKGKEVSVRYPSSKDDFAPEFSPSGHLLAINGFPAGVWAYERPGPPTWAPFERDNKDDASYSKIIFNAADEEIVATIGGRPVEVWRWHHWAPASAPAGPAPPACPPAPGAEPLWTDAQSTRAERVLLRTSAAFSGYIGRSIVYIGAGGEPRLAHWSADDRERRIPRILDGGAPPGRDALVVAAEYASDRIAVSYADTTVTELDGDRVVARVTQEKKVETLAIRDGKVTSLTEDDAWIWSGAPIGHAVTVGNLKPNRGPMVSPNARFHLIDTEWGVGVKPTVGGKPTMLPKTEAVLRSVFVDDERVVTAHVGGVRLWSWREPKVVWALAMAENVFQLALDPSRKFLAVATDAHTVSIFPIDGKTAASLCSLPIPGGVGAMAFSRSGDFLITVDGDRLARIWARWNTPLPVEVSRLASFAPISSAQFSNDERSILLETIDSGETGIERFLWRNEDFLPQVCARLDRLVGVADRALYVEACRPRKPASAIHQAAH